MIFTFKKVFRNKNYRNIFIYLNMFFVFLYFLYTNLSFALDSAYLSIFTTGEKMKLFFTSFFDVSELRDPFRLLLLFLFVISISIFFLFVFVLFKDTRKVSLKKTLFGSLGTFIAIVGLSCAACGFGLLFSILSFFGASSAIVYFPLHGLELGYLGIIFLNISNYFLLKRIKNPFVC